MAASTRSSSSASSAPASQPQAPDNARPVQHIPAADRCLRGGAEVLPQLGGSAVGLVDRAADRDDPGGAAAADGQALPRDEEDGAPHPRDEGDPAEVQGGQGAPAAGADEVLQGE